MCFLVSHFPDSVAKRKAICYNRKVDIYFLALAKKGFRYERKSHIPQPVSVYPRSGAGIFHFHTGCRFLSGYADFLSGDVRQPYRNHLILYFVRMPFPVVFGGAETAAGENHCDGPLRGKPASVHAAVHHTAFRRRQTGTNRFVYRSHFSGVSDLQQCSSAEDQLAHVAGGRQKAGGFHFL